MLDYIKSHGGTIVFSLVLLILGVVLGLTIEEDGNGIYLSASYPQGGTIFVIGKNTENIADIDLKSLSDAETHILASKIKNLAVEDLLSHELREMAKKSDGPFVSIPVVVRLHLTNEVDLAGPVAKACKNTPVYGNALVAYEALGDQQHILSISGLMDIHVVSMQLSNCTMEKDGYYDVWISKDYVAKWIQSSDLPESGISVRANIVVAGVGI